MAKDFPGIYSHLNEMMGRLGEAAPETMAGFGQLHVAAGREGVISAKTKELISLAIGIAVHCDGCISFHVHDALAAGASREEIVEVIGVAVTMGGGPSVVYGCEALEAVDQFESAGVE
ncbi:MAG: carboxymuconolactone decarboxylase family protein [Solirubrobacterales bacterium]